MFLIIKWTIIKKNFLKDFLKTKKYWIAIDLEESRKYTV